MAQVQRYILQDLRATLSVPTSKQRAVGHRGSTNNLIPTSKGHQKRLEIRQGPRLPGGNRICSFKIFKIERVVRWWPTFYMPSMAKR